MDPTTRTATKTSATNTPAAGILNNKMDIQFQLTARKGELRKNPRAGSINVFKSNIGHRFVANKTKAMHVVKKTYAFLSTIIRRCAL